MHTPFSQFGSFHSTCCLDPLQVEEPELLEDEADGEDERSNWSEGEGEEELDFEEEESEEDEDLLNRLEASIAAKGGGS